MKKRITKPYDAKRALVKKQLAKEFDCTEQHIGNAIRGNSVTEQSIKIAKEYKIRYDKLIAALK